MTREFLHNNPDFTKLFSDPRFLTAVMFLRKHVAPRNDSAPATDQMLHKAGRVEGWLACLDALEDLQNPPAANTTPVRSSAPYTTSESK